MKHFIILSLFATLCVAVHATTNYRRTPLGDAVDKASMRMLKEAFDVAGDKNVVVSPLGALTLLSMYSAGTKGKSREEIVQLLGFTDHQQLEESYSSLTDKFSSMNYTYLALANKLYLSNKSTLDERFSEIARRSYKSQVEQVDFAQQKITVDIINQWASEKTLGHINSVVNQDMINKDTALALFNVIFFQGHWHVPFNASETEMKRFFVRRQWADQKPMMKLHDYLDYYEDHEIGASMAELPYQEKGFRMVVILPHKRHGLPEVLEKLAERGLLDDVFQLSNPDRLVHFEMPKFEIKNKVDLKYILPKMGVSHIFTEGARGIVQEEIVKVSEALQEAFVKVDEEGATAGAVTGLFLMSIFGGSPPAPLEFRVDHPFMFAILHEDIVLFTGTYTH